MRKPVIPAFSLLLALCVLQGCSITSDYPFDSQVLELSHDCHEIAGVYWNKGETKHIAPTYEVLDIYLFDEITNEGIFGTHECNSCTVTLAWLDSGLNVLSVILHDSSGNTLEEAILKSANGDYTCEDGLVSVGILEGFEAYVEGYIRSGTRKYFLDEEGSLIQEASYTALGHTLVVIPLGVSATDYSRWNKVVQQKRTLYQMAMESDNKQERIELLCQSGINGKSHAAAQLGLIYAAGLDGIKPDLVESYKWYGLADRLGSASAADAMLLLKQRMTKRQYSDAMRLLDEITDSSSCENFN